MCNGHPVQYIAVWRIQSVLMRIRIPLFKLTRIRIQLRIQKLFSYSEREKKISYQIFIFLLLHNLTKLVMCNFLSYNAGGGTRVEG